MSDYEVIIRGLLLDAAHMTPPAEEYGPTLRGVMRELMKLDTALPSVSGTAAEGLLEARVLVAAESIAEAAVLGCAQVRTAIHAAGVGTPGWNVQALMSRLADAGTDDAEDTDELAAFA